MFKLKLDMTISSRQPASVSALRFDVLIHRQPRNHIPLWYTVHQVFILLSGGGASDQAAMTARDVASGKSSRNAVVTATDPPGLWSKLPWPWSTEADRTHPLAALAAEPSQSATSQHWTIYCAGRECWQDQAELAPRKFDTSRGD
jgi:hypothetical protein